MSDNFSLDNFIHFGRILNKKQREGLVSYWLYKTKKDLTKKINSEILLELTNYTNIIDKIIRKKILLKLVKENDEIFDDITERVFVAFENVDKEINLDGPFKEEEMSLLKWKSKTRRSIIKESDVLLKTIKNFYKSTDINTSFYEKEFDKINNDREQKKSKDKLQLKEEALRREILGKWESKLDQKKSLLFLKELDKARKELTKKLYEQMDKLEELMKLLKPFTNELGRLWDLSAGFWNKINFNILHKYSEFLEKEPELQKLAEYLGRMHEVQDEIEEERIKEILTQPKMKVQYAGKSELVGIHESSDINNLLPNEVCLLIDQLTETVFYKKLAEKKLLTYQFISRESYLEFIEQEKTREIPKKDRRGPIIICVDTSGSMHGTPEYVAKVLCFAILKIALMHERRCYLISFSTKIRTLELTNLNDSLLNLIDFLSHSFRGGTDASPALREAIDKTKQSDYIKADILMISDFIMNKISEDLATLINNCKSNGTRFHSLVISSTGNPSILEIFDNNWIYNPDNEKPFKDILKNIRYLNTRSEIVT